MGIFCTLKNITLSFGNKHLFKEASFTIHKGDRIGLIGLNGHGKSSLFKILNGAMNPDISTPPFKFDKSRGLNNHADEFSVFMVPQELPLKKNELVTIKDYVYRFYLKQENIDQSMIDNFDQTNNWQISNSYNSYLKFFGLSDLNLIVHKLSGGEQKKVLLAIGLSSPANIILWDEPTNHIDIETIKLFENELSNSSKTYILVSHDRYLLSRLTDKIMHIENGKIVSFEGGYQDYLEHLDSLDMQNIKLLDRLKNNMRRETAWMRQGIKARGTRSKKRVEDYNHLKNAITDLRQRAKKELQLNIIKSDRKTKKLVEFKNVEFGYNNTCLLKNISFTIRKGDKIGLLGINGAGKTTLVNLICETLKTTTGQAYRATDLKIRYFSQQRDELSPEKTPFELLATENDFVHLPDGRQMHVTAYFESFLFSKEDIRRPITSFSGGEKNRITLAMNLAMPGDLLIFDEPTNDLDLETIKILEKKLSAFTGSLILITHDRAFLSNVTNKVWQIRKNSIEFFEAGYSQVEPYLEAIALEESIQKENEQIPLENEPNDSTASKNLSTKMSHTEKMRLKSIEHEVGIIETELEGIEKEIETFDFSDMNESKHMEYQQLSNRQSYLEENLLKFYEEIDVFKSS